MAATKLTADELDKLDDVKLAEELAKAKDELFKLRFQNATGQLESSGRVMFEVAGVEEEVAREALRLAMHKLPMKCRILSRESGDI